jgi:hypothetical protein
MAETVAEHRKLRFESIDDAIAEVDRVVAAESAGRLRRSGNWTAGQTFGHLAAWINYGYEGYPLRTPPWFVRVILRTKLRKMLREGMPRGVRIPNVPEGTYGTEVLPTEEGVRRLRAAFERLRREPAVYDSPALGRMSQEHRIRLNLRHAELHLGYLHP